MSPHFSHVSISSFFLIFFAKNFLSSLSVIVSISLLHSNAPHSVRLLLKCCQLRHFFYYTTLGFSYPPSLEMCFGLLRRTFDTAKCTVSIAFLRSSRPLPFRTFFRMHFYDTILTHPARQMFDWSPL